MGKYSDELTRNRKTTPDEIRSAKNKRSHTRNVQRKVERAEQKAERLARWQGLTDEQKLSELDARPGQCAKQRKKILARMEKDGQANQPAA